MAIERVNLRTQYDNGEIWVQAETAGDALDEVRAWCEENPPWEVHDPEPEQGDDGRFKFMLERAYSQGEGAV